LYEIFFTAGASKLEEILKQNETMSPASWFIAYSAGLAAIQKYGGAKEGSRTMLDALIPAHRAAEKLISTKSSQAPASRPSSSKLLEAAATAAQNGAEATKKISTKKAFGRSGYVGEEFGRDIPDPGAKAAAIWIAAVHKIHQSIQ
jgi:dihydroxyacetone kinase